MRQLTIERAAVIIVFALLFALATRIPTDTDVWWHLRAAQYMLSEGFIYRDPFSLTMAGQPWINHSWGAQIVLYGFWRVAGSFGLAIYTSLLATLGMVLVYRMSSGSVYLRAFALIVGAAAAAVFWSPRPQMVSFFLSALLLYLLHLQKYSGVDRLWFIPLLMALWGNLHAGFSIGFIILFGSIVGETLNRLLNPTGEYVLTWSSIRRRALVTILSVAALIINPYGLQMLSVPFQTISIGALQNFIQEWNSPNFHERQTWPFVFLLLALLGAVGASRRRLDWTDYLLSAGTAFMSLLAGRNIATFAVVATPVLTRHLGDALASRGWDVTPVRRVTPRMARLNAALVSIIVLASALKVLLVLDSRTVAEAQRDLLPVAVADHIRQSGLAGPMFNSYNFGGYLMFALPDLPVFVDGRTDLYGDAFLTGTYVPLITAQPGWQDILARWDIRTVVVEEGSGLARALQVEPGWRRNYEDEQAVVFVREV